MMHLFEEVVAEIAGGGAFEAGTRHWIYLCLRPFAAANHSVGAVNVIRIPWEPHRNIPVLMQSAGRCLSERDILVHKKK